MLPIKYLVASCLVLLATASAAHANFHAGSLTPTQPVDSQATLEVRLLLLLTLPLKLTSFAWHSLVLM